MLFYLEGAENVWVIILEETQSFFEKHQMKGFMIAPTAII